MKKRVHTGTNPLCTLYYVAQSFLLADSIFGLDQYIRIIKKHYHETGKQ